MLIGQDKEVNDGSLFFFFFCLFYDAAFECEGEKIKQ